MPFVQNRFIECQKCNRCGYITLEQKRLCPKCGGMESAAIQSEGKGRLIDFTIIYFPPEAYKDLAPYTSVLVELNNGCKFFGIMKGEHSDLQPNSPVIMTGHDEANGGIFFESA